MRVPSSILKSFSQKMELDMENGFVGLDFGNINDETLSFGQEILFEEWL